MRCPGCGSPVHPNWDSCRGCGAALEGVRSGPATWALPAVPRPFTDGIRRVAERVRTAQPPSLEAPRAALRALPRPSRPQLGAGPVRQALAAPRLRWRVPRLGGAGGGLLPAVVASAVVAMLVMAVMGGMVADARAEAHAAREAEAATSARLAELQAAVAGAEQARGQLQTAAQQAQASASSVAGERDELRQRLDQSAKDLAELQSKLTAATASLDQQTAVSAQQRQQVRVLTECLSGTMVAVEFGRSGRWSSADRALEVVKDSCTAARALL